MKLEQLLIGIPFQLLQGSLDIEISGIAYDSRRVKPGQVFVCVAGFNSDGHAFAGQAEENGAIALIVEKDLEIEFKGTVLRTPDSRQAMALLAANFYRRPSQHLRVVGVTGTNGKTTTTHLIKAILEESGKKTAIMGTLYAQVGDRQYGLGHTTPEALEIEEFMDICRQEGAEYVIMEVSSHALSLRRVEEIDFNVAVFTNLTQDHLDFHEDMESYREAKGRLFDIIADQAENFSIINADDPAAAYYTEKAGENVLTFGLGEEAGVRAEQVAIDMKGSSFQIKYGKKSLKITMKLTGMFSIYNALAAIAFALREGIEPRIIKSALGKIEGVPGRFESVDWGQNFAVIVDYAHTPDGLENVLLTARQIVPKRLITVFGCGGDRDRGKRPLMGEIAARYSDFCLVTSDNPRNEEPEDIISDILPGLNKVEDSRYAIVADRREAIHHAIFMAKEGDMVMIAGKGHENYQLVKGRVLDFDDRLVAAEFLKEK